MQSSERVRRRRQARHIDVGCLLVDLIDDFDTDAGAAGNAHKLVVNVLAGEKLLEDGGVAAIPGAAFGSSGKDFVRFSFASSVANLREAADRIMKVSTAWQGTLVGR